MVSSSLWFTLIALAILAPYQVHAVSVNVNGFLFGTFAPSPANDSVSITIQAVPNPNFFFELGFVALQPRIDCPIDVTIYQGLITGVTIAAYDAAGNLVQDVFQTFPAFLNVSSPFTVSIAKGATAWSVVVAQDASSVAWPFPFTTNPPVSHARTVFLNGTGTATASSLQFVPAPIVTNPSISALPVTSFTQGGTVVFNLTNQADIYVGSSQPNRNIAIEITTEVNRIIFTSIDANGVVFRGVPNTINLTTNNLVSYLVTVTQDATFWEVQVQQGSYVSPTFYWPIFNNIPVSTITTLTLLHATVNTVSLS